MTSPSSFPWQPSNPCRGFRKPTSYASSPKRSHPGLLDRERFSESWLRPERRKNRQDSPLAEHGRNKIPKSELYYKIAKRLKNINANSTFGFLSFFNLTRGIVGDIWYLGAFGLQFQSAMFTVHLNSTVVCSSKSMRQLASVFCFGRWWAITSMTGHVTTQQLFQVIILPAWTLQLQASDEIMRDQIQISG